MTTSENDNDALSTSQAQTQTQACRALVVWSRYQLAVASGVPKRRLAGFARGDSVPQRRAIPEVRAAFEAAGVALNDDVAPGIRLRRGS
jgi:hypothetical protein